MRSAIAFLGDGYLLHERWLVKLCSVVPKTFA